MRRESRGVTLRLCSHKIFFCRRQTKGREGVELANSNAWRGSNERVSESQVLRLKRYKRSLSSSFTKQELACLGEDRHVWSSDSQLAAKKRERDGQFYLYVCAQYTEHVKFLRVKMLIETPEAANFATETTPNSRHCSHSQYSYTDLILNLCYYSETSETERGRRKRRWWQNMPVLPVFKFHTKLIQSILDPVAQQVKLDSY